MDTLLPPPAVLSVKDLFLGIVIGAAEYVTLLYSMATFFTSVKGLFITNIIAVIFLEYIHRKYKKNFLIISGIILLPLGAGVLILLVWIRFIILS